jgi:hypothetical protein
MQLNPSGGDLGALTVAIFVAASTFYLVRKHFNAMCVPRIERSMAAGGSPLASLIFIWGYYVTAGYLTVLAGGALTIESLSSSRTGPIDPVRLQSLMYTGLLVAGFNRILSLNYSTTTARASAVGTAIFTGIASFVVLQSPNKYSDLIDALSGRTNFTTTLIASSLMIAFTVEVAMEALRRFGPAGLSDASGSFAREYLYAAEEHKVAFGVRGVTKAYNSTLFPYLPGQLQTVEIVMRTPNPKIVQTLASVSNDPSVNPVRFRLVVGPHVKSDDVAATREQLQKHGACEVKTVERLDQLEFIVLNGDIVSVACSPWREHDDPPLHDVSFTTTSPYVVLSYLSLFEVLWAQAT